MPLILAKIVTGKLTSAYRSTLKDTYQNDPSANAAVATGIAIGYCSSHKSESTFLYKLT